MENGVIGFGRNCEQGWGFFLNGIEYSGYNTRETARKWYNQCKIDMYNLFKKYGCSNDQDEFKAVKRYAIKHTKTN